MTVTVIPIGNVSQLSRDHSHAEIVAKDLDDALEQYQQRHHLFQSAVYKLEGQNRWFFVMDIKRQL